MRHWIFATALVTAALAAGTQARAQDEGEGLEDSAVVEDDFKVRPLEGTPADPEIAKPEVVEFEIPSPVQPEPEIEPARPQPKVEPPPAKPETLPAPPPETPAPVEPPKPPAPPPAPAKPATPKAAPSVQAPARSEAEFAREELKFYEGAFETASPDVLEPLLEEVDGFLSRYRDQDGADQALFLMASIRERQGDLVGGAVDLLKILYEYPQTKLAFNAKRKLLDIADKKLKKQKTALTQIAQDQSKVTDLDQPGRLAALLKALTAVPEKEFYKPLGDELRGFLARYPGHPGAGEITFLLARHHARNGQYRAAILLNQKVLALYPDAGLRAKAQSEIAGLYAASLKDYNRAVEAYLSLAEKYPGTPEAGESYVKMAKILDENLNQSALAVEKLDEIVRLYPNTDAAYQAFLEQARIQRNRLSAPAKAVAAHEGLAEMFPGERGVASLKEAADISASAKDFAAQTRLLEKFVEKYPDDKYSPEALWEAADVYQERLTDPAGAKRVLEKLSSAYSGTKFGKKALKRLSELGK